RETTEPKTRPARAPRRGVPPWAFAAVAVLGAALLAAGAYFILKGPRDAAKAPEPPEAQPPEPKPKPKQPAETARAVAEWVLDSGGIVVLDGTKHVTGRGNLPRGPLVVTGIYFHDTTYRVTDDDVPRLRALPDLVSISIAVPTDLTETGLLWLAELPRATAFTSLHLWLSAAAAPGIPQLARCKDLKYLCLVGAPLGGRVEFVRALPFLSQLNLTDCKLTNDDLAALAGCRLYTLALQNNPGITGEGLKHLVAIPDVEQFNLGGTGIAPADLPLLAKVPRLTILTLPDLKLTDDDLAFLRELPNLLTLNLANNTITDRVIDHMSGATKLSHLVLHGTRLTDAGLERLAAREGG
ncbi:MAG: hypothetical protein FJ304_22050, partial [Planctomycetes bacterium]|nr:hypothetical protein [Planctomycetota bacterium]